MSHTVKIEDPGNWNLLRGALPDDVLDRIEEEGGGPRPLLLRFPDGSAMFFEDAEPLSIEFERPGIAIPVDVNSIEQQFTFVSLLYDAPSLLNALKRSPPESPSEPDLDV